MKSYPFFIIQGKCKMLATKAQSPALLATKRAGQRKNIKNFVSWCLCGYEIIILNKMRMGFTIIELMIVVALIGLLFTLTIPNLIRNRNITREKLCLNNKRLIGHAVLQYMIENSLSSVTGLTVDVAADYIKGGIPECPSDPADDNNDYTIGNGTGGGVLVTCVADLSHTPPYDTGAP